MKGKRCVLIFDEVQLFPIAKAMGVAGVDAMSQSAYDDACRPGNPRETSVEEIAELYKSLL